MKIVLAVKNTSQALTPTKDDVVIYDGDQWYVTTKQDVLKEASDLLEATQNELAALKEETVKFKKEVASQLYEMSELIRKLYSDGGK